MRLNRISDAFFAGARVFVPSHSGESALLLDELAADPERARDVHFMGIQFPGIGRGDYLAAHPTARQTSFFMSPAVRQGLQQGRAGLLSLDYLGVTRHLRDMNPVDVALMQVSPPDERGFCSAGLCSDFGPLAWANATRRIAHVNPRMPRTAGSFQIRLEDIDGYMEAETPIVEFQEPAFTQVEAAVAAHAAALVRDGDTLQFGIGSVPVALTRALTGHRQLRLHSGMAPGAVQALWEAGALDRDARITTGVALGNCAFYEFVAGNDRFWFDDVSKTHDPFLAGNIERFIAINSAVEVDLFGQVNSERASGVLQAGAGGLPAFAQAALRSPGGRSLICLPATARRGAVSRVVAALDSNAVCTVPRYLADVVVTEYGVAQLRGLSLNERAQAMIRIAAPAFQSSLEAAWAATRHTL